MNFIAFDCKKWYNIGINFYGVLKMYENNGFNYNQDFYEEYTSSKIKEARRVFSRIFLALLFFILALNVTVLLVETILILALGKTEAVNLINSSVYLPWLLNSLPQYLVAFPVFFLIVRGMKTSEAKKSKLKISEFLSLFLISQVAILAGSIIGETVNDFFTIFKGETVTNPLDSMISGSPVWIVLIFTVILAPIFEELIFRKLIIDRLSRFGSGLAITVSAIAFGLFHGNFYQLFYAVALGFILGYMYEKTKDVRYPIILHALINFLGSVVAMLIGERMVRFEAMLESISKKIEVDMSVFIQDMMIVGSYSLLQYALVGGGIAVLVSMIKRKKFKLQSIYDYKIPKERVSSTVILNVGAILFLLTSTLTFILNVIM